MDRELIDGTSAAGGLPRPEAVERDPRLDDRPRGAALSQGTGQGGGRTTRHPGYGLSQRIRKRIEDAFGWIKTIAGQERTEFRGRRRLGWAVIFTAC